MYSVCADKFLDTLSKVYADVLSEGVANPANAGMATSGLAAPIPRSCRRPADGVCVVFKSAGVWWSEFWTGG